MSRWIAVGLVSVCFAADLSRKAQSGISFGVNEGKLVIFAAAGNAAQAGLKKGDVILRANDEAARAEAAFVRPLARRNDGDRVEFVVERDGREFKIPMEYRAAPKEHPAGVDVQYRAVETDGHLRRALVTEPKQSGRRPAVLWIAGSGCGSQESPDGSGSEAQILYELTRRGFVTMRVEKTNAGDSEGPPCYSDSGDMSQEVRGYAAGINALRSYDFVDGERIYLLGHSAGSTLAPLVARGNRVRGIVVAGVMGTNFYDYVVAMRRRELELGGKSKQEIASTMAINERCLTRLIRDRIAPGDIEQAMPDCQHRVRFDSPPPYIREWADMNLEQAWKAAPDVPVLVLYGSADFVSSAAESRALVETINKAHPHRASWKELSMNHDFQTFESQKAAWAAEQRGRGSELNREVVNQIEQFLKKN